jgi:hypothetical protein
MAPISTLSSPTFSSQRIALRTALSPKHVLSHSVATEGQQKPWSLAWSARLINTALGVGGSCSGQQSAMMRVLISLPYRSVIWLRSTR